VRTTHVPTHLSVSTARAVVLTFIPTRCRTSNVTIDRTGISSLVFNLTTSFSARRATPTRTFAITSLVSASGSCTLYRFLVRTSAVDWNFLSAALRGSESYRRLWHTIPVFTSLQSYTAISTPMPSTGELNETASCLILLLGPIM